ncbi:MAG: hypothetical protein IPL26_24125 [Leptospiraceae bacterium]|nr:hypothetical protein [Leptospiraceae bacterium]
MVTISKQQMAEWILLDYLARTHSLKEKISFYLKKYNTNFEEFEKQVTTASKEDFEKWDDYIEWKAFHNFYSSYLIQIEEVKNGNFQLAE